MKSLLGLFTFLFLSTTWALPAQIQGKDVLSEKEITVAAEKDKKLVVVFLSASCPCSNSHIKELTSLAETYKDFNFVGVHSNSDEGAEMSKDYFAKAHLPFAVIQDTSGKIADQFKALKTPHSFVVQSGGETLFRGGVSNSHVGETADRKYLREALDDLHQGKNVRTPEARTLGCAIARGEKNAW